MPEFKWDPKSALRKATSDISASICLPANIVAVCKSIQITGPNDPNKDAFRNCAICGKHINFHKNGRCGSKL